MLWNLEPRQKPHSLRKWGSGKGHRLQKSPDGLRKGQPVNRNRTGHLQLISHYTKRMHETYLEGYINHSTQRKRCVGQSIDGCLPTRANQLADVEVVTVEAMERLVENVLETRHVELTSWLMLRKPT